ncbi:hypothetical protein [Halomonas sp. C05BenzN]|uniref:hypothetical protein n=1 Tax=Halomonas sp. C05BenzN TaxID=3411041 RepID=UPI003B926B32
MITLNKARDAVKLDHPRAYASKHNNPLGQHSHWCVWTRLANGLRLATGNTEREAWNKALATVEKQASDSTGAEHGNP